APLVRHPTARPPPTPSLFPYTTLFRSAMQTRPTRMSHGAEVALSTSPAAPPRPRKKNATRFTVAGLASPEPTSRSGPTRSSSVRSEEHTSELQSRENLVCRPLLEKKKK